MIARLQFETKARNSHKCSFSPHPLFIASDRVRVGRDHLAPRTAREFPDETLPAEGAKLAHFDAWAAILLDEDHPGRAGTTRPSTASPRTQRRSCRAPGEDKEEF